MVASFAVVLFRRELTVPINRGSWHAGSTCTHPRVEVAAAERHHHCQKQGDEGPEMAAASEHTAGEYIGYPAGTSTPRVWFGGEGSYPGTVARKPTFSVQNSILNREKRFAEVVDTEFDSRKSLSDKDL